MKASMTILVAVLTVGSVGLAATSALACHGGSWLRRLQQPLFLSPLRASACTLRKPVIVAPTFAPAHSVVVVMPGDSWFSICAREYGNSSPWSKVADFNGMPQNVQLNGGMQLRLPVINPNGSFSLSSAPAAIARCRRKVSPVASRKVCPQGLPQGGQPGPQGGVPQVNGFAPQGQGFAPQQLPMGHAPRCTDWSARSAACSASSAVWPPGCRLVRKQQLLRKVRLVRKLLKRTRTTRPVAQRIAEQLTGLPGEPNGQPAAPNAGPTDRPLPSILIGSIMTINGQPLGDNRGTVRLIVNGSPVALEIVEWSANGCEGSHPGRPARRHPSSDRNPAGRWQRGRQGRGATGCRTEGGRH